MNKVNPKAMSVALLSGGKSHEREISLASGAATKGALENLGFSVQTLDPANKGDLAKLVNGNFDVAFLCLHGKYGEDGTVQGLLETIGLPYTGSGVWASATAINKANSKIFYERNNIPTPQSIKLNSPNNINVSNIVNKLGNNVVVKAATEGSAIGVFIVQGAAEIEGALNKAFEVDSEVLVESYITGREFTIAVLGNSNAQALPIIEIIPKSSFYDYESKYAKGGSKHVCPAEIDDSLARAMQNAAVAAHKALGCAGVSRTDFILDAENNFWVLETNTIPGMTETSLLPDAAKAAGISFEQLCLKLIEFALQK